MRYEIEFMTEVKPGEFVRLQVAAASAHDTAWIIAETLTDVYGCDLDVTDKATSTIIHTARFHLTNKAF